MPRRSQSRAVLQVLVTESNGGRELVGPEHKASGRWLRLSMAVVRRWLLLWSLMFWQGGFTFYGGIVVPVGSAVLGSEREQGFITRKVTNYLNLAGAVALVVWGWDLWAMRETSPGGRRLRWAIWAGLVLSLILLVGLHPRLDELVAPEDMMVLDRRRFRSLHERYLIVSTVQWVGCLLLTALMIRAWQHEDATAADAL